VSVSLPKKSTDKVSIVIDAKTSDTIPQAVKDIHNYIENLPEIKQAIARIKGERDLRIKNLTEEINLRIKNLIEAKRANLIFLSQVTDIMKKRQESFVAVNPSDLIMRDAALSLEITRLQQAKKNTMGKESRIAIVNPSVLIDKTEALSLEIINLQQTEVAFGTLGPVSTTVQPSSSQIRKIIISTGALSLSAAIFVVFFLIDYIDRIKARENK
jgi:hypothetical protein